MQLSYNILQSPISLIHQAPVLRGSVGFDPGCCRREHPKAWAPDLKAPPSFAAVSVRFAGRGKNLDSPSRSIGRVAVMLEPCGIMQEVAMVSQLSIRRWVWHQGPRKAVRCHISLRASRYRSLRAHASAKAGAGRCTAFKSDSPGSASLRLLPFGQGASDQSLSSFGG